MSSLSVIVITKNEAALLARCLASVSFADEIIVVDSGSTDETVQIAREYTDKVYETDWPGFGPQKNRALGYATCEWVLSIDADEALTPELVVEVKALVQGETALSGFWVRRLNAFMGRQMRFGDWRNDWVLRLFRRDAGRYTDDLVHERVVVEGETGRLPGLLQHDSVRSLTASLNKMNSYSDYLAARKVSKGVWYGLFQGMLHGWWTFMRGYFFRLGFLDGLEGFLLAILNAEGAFYKYVKAGYR